MLPPPVLMLPRWEPYSCGWVSTFTVLRHFKRDTTHLWRDLKIESQEGTHPHDLFRVLRKAGLGIRHIPVPLNPKLVRETLERDEPIILMMRCGLRETSTLHWVTIVGQDGRQYYLSDSTHNMGLCWRHIPKVKHLFAFSVGEFRTTLNAKQFRRLANQHY